MRKENICVIRCETEAALERILGRLGSFAISSGLSVSQLERLLRAATVRCILTSAENASERKSISQISALTGLSRTAVSKIMKPPVHIKPEIQLREKYTNRILAAWHRDPKYIDKDGLPKTIPIFGRGISFETLTRTNGGGIPVRAMIDELLRIAAVKILPNRRVKALKLVAVGQGSSVDMIRSMGVKVEDLIGSLLHNTRMEASPRFVASVESTRISIERLALVRREVADRGSTFISELEESLFSDSKPGNRKSRDRPEQPCRAGIAVFYFEDGRFFNNVEKDSLRRKNLRRR